METMPGESDDVYRLNRIERDIAEVKASIMSIQSSVAALQVGFNRDFTPRTETELSHKDMARQIMENRDRIDNWEGRQWQLILGLVLALLTAVIGLLRTIPAPHL